MSSAEGEVVAVAVAAVTIACAVVAQDVELRVVRRDEEAFAL